jgi:glycerophosphoryl diester phosphodiesterase
VLGHRGAPWLHQENSLAGLRRAIELGADGVEFDVFLTRDGRAVVFHDLDLERLTGHRGRITDLTWDEVSKLRLQRRVAMGKNARGEDVVLEFEREEPISLLEEVLSELGGKCLMDVELKPAIPSHAEREVGAQAAEIVVRAGVADDVVITSFDFFKLAAAEEVSPALHTGFAYDDGFFDTFEGFLRSLPELPGPFARAAGNQNVETILGWLAGLNSVGRFIGSTVVNAEATLLDGDTVARFHERSMPVGAYTLFPLDTTAVKQLLSDEEEVARALRLAAAGVDWFETDDPARLLAILER